MTVPSETDELRDQVRRFVAEVAGVELERLTPQSRLNYEIGIDGDDADDFFEQFAGRFGVDLEQLRLHGGQHFGSEGMTLSTGALVFGIPFFIGFALSELFRSVDSWLWFAVSYLLWLVTLWMWVRFRNRESQIPITIQDLVDSAAAKKWVKVYSVTE